MFVYVRLNLFGRFNYSIIETEKSVFNQGYISKAIFKFEVTKPTYDSSPLTSSVVNDLPVKSPPGYARTLSGFINAASFTVVPAKQCSSIK